VESSQRNLDWVSQWTMRVDHPKEFVRSISREFGSLDLLGKLADGSERFDHWVLL